MAAKSNKASKITTPAEWSFDSPEVARAFDSYVRTELPWYDLATGAVAHIARCFVPQEGNILDVGCSTGNICAALLPVITARRARYVGIDISDEMIKVFNSRTGRPWYATAVRCDVRAHDFYARRADLIVCFLSLMFVPVNDRETVLNRMKSSLNVGGAIVIVDKTEPQAGYTGTVNYRLTLAAKHEAGALPEEIIKKELSIAGLQRPMRASELEGFVEFFRFGDFGGYVWEKV